MTARTALEIAFNLDAYIFPTPTMQEAADMLRQQHAEIGRLKIQLRDVTDTLSLVSDVAMRLTVGLAHARDDAVKMREKT